VKAPAYKENLRETIQHYPRTVSDQSLQTNPGPEELFCGWFNDWYFPAFNPKSFNAGVFEEGLKLFESCFSKEELNALHSFHEYFNSIHEIDLDRDFDDLQKDPAWVELDVQAQKALAAFSK